MFTALLTIELSRVALRRYRARRAYAGRHWLATA